MRRGIYTQPYAGPRSAPERVLNSMQKPLDKVSAAKKRYNQQVDSARLQLMHHVVDPLYSRWSYQVAKGQTDRSFGEWVLEKRNLSNTYAKMGDDAVLWAYGGIVQHAITDERYRYFDALDATEDWLTPLIEQYVNRRVEETWFTVRVTSYTVPLVNFRHSLPSLRFVRDLVPGQHA